MTNYNHKFKKNLIADWIVHDLSAAIREGVKTNSFPKAFVAASAIAASLAISPLTLASQTIDQVINTPSGSPYSGNLIIDSGNEAAIHGTNQDILIKTIANSSENGDITMNVGEAHGILAELIEGNSIEINAAGTVTVSPKGSDSGDDGDGINVTAENKGNLSFTAGVSNIINANSQNGDGIYIDSGSSGNITLVANGTEGNGNIIKSDNNGIDHRGSQTISLEATSGINSINTQRGDGLRLEGQGTIALSGYDNKITAGDNGIQVSQGQIQLNASNNNFIEGALAGIQVDDQGTVSLSATNNEIHGVQYGINSTNGTININSRDAFAQTTLISAASEEKAFGINIADLVNESQYNTELNIFSNKLVIEASGKNDSSTPTVSGVHTESNLRLIDIQTKEGGLSISTTAGNLNENGFGSVSGIYSTNSKVKLTSDGLIDISSKFNGSGNSSAIYLGNEPTHLSDSSVELATKGSIKIYSETDKGSAFGVQVNYNDRSSSGYTSSVTLKSSGDISITTKNNSKGITSPVNSNGINVAGGTFYSESFNGSTIIKSMQDGQNEDITALGINVQSYKSAPFDSSATIISQINNEIEADNAIYALGEKSKISLTAKSGSNIFKTMSAGVVAYQGSEITLSANQGINQIIADATGIIATDYNDIGEKSSVELSAGLNTINATAYGIRARTKSEVSLTSTDYVDFNNALVTGNAIQVSSTDEVDNTYGITSSLNSIVKLTANKGDNLISVASLNVDGHGEYGTGYAVFNESGSQTTLTANSGKNILFGSIYNRSSSDEGKASVSLNAKTNNVYSNSVIENAGNLQGQSDDTFKDNRVISALYAEGKGAQISLTSEQNYLSTFADSSVHTDLERVVWAYDGADINIDGFTSITTDSYEKSLNSIDIAIAAGTAVNLTEDIVNADVADRAQVQINYANTTDSEGKAVLSSVTGDILSAYAGTVNIAPKSASDGLVVTGNLLAGNNGELTVDIGANGVLTGRADDYGDAGFITDSEHTTFFDPAFSSEIFKGGQVNLKLGDNARWNVTGQSWITDISVADGAKNVLIDLVNANTDRNSTAHALTVYNLKGNATFNMSLDGNRDVSDMLYIRNANGEYNVNVVDAVTVDDMYKGGLNGLRFATVGAGSKAKFRAFTYDKGALNVEYEVATDSYDNNPENDIYNGTEMSHEKPGSTVVDGLFSYEEGAVATLALNDEASTKAADGTISETTNFKLVDRKDATPSDSGKTIIDHARANYANAVQLDTLNKRQGEMRFSQGHEDGLWARIRHDDIGKRSSFRLDNTMVEVGVDSRYVKETGEFHTGVAFDYMNGDTDYHHISGEGDLDRYGVWFYTTWLGNEGDYTDFIIKCSLIDNEYKIYAPTTGEKITGDYDNNVISVSLEHGKKYSNEESWFIEPQAQLQYAYVTSAEYTNSQGTDVRLDGIHSLIGRVGVRAGKDVTRDNPFTFYARGDIMHEFMGKQDIKAKDATGTMRVRYENDDTWYSAGLGMSYQHNKDKYYFLEAEKVFGGSNTSSYIVSGGVRFLFD